MTNLEVIKDAIDTLGKQSIPVFMVEPLGTELNRVRNNLIILLNNEIKKQEEAKDAPTEATEEPKEPEQATDEPVVIEEAPNEE